MKIRGLCKIANTEFEKCYQVTSRVVVIQIIAVLVLITVAYFVTTEVDNSVSENAVLLMWAAIVILIIGTILLNKILFSWETLKRVFHEKGSSGLLADLQIKTIFVGTIIVIIAIIGFLIATLSGNKFEMFRAGTAALVIFLFNFPRKSNWQRILAKLESTTINNEKE